MYMQHMQRKRAACTCSVKMQLYMQNGQVARACSHGHAVWLCSMDIIKMCSANDKLLIYLVRKSANFLLDG
jgi:hypothetical protein